jgi:hypothetical protein
LSREVLDGNAFEVFATFLETVDLIAQADDLFVEFGDLSER